MPLFFTINIIGKPREYVEQLLVSDRVYLWGLISHKSSYLYQIEFVSGASYHMRAQLECDIRPHKQRDLIQVAVAHMSVVLLYHSLNINGYNC